MTKLNRDQQAEPFFLTEELEAELIAVGSEFEPPSHARTISLRKILADLTEAELAMWPIELLNGEVIRSALVHETGESSGSGDRT